MRVIFFRNKPFNIYNFIETDLNNQGEYNQG